MNIYTYIREIVRSKAKIKKNSPLRRCSSRTCRLPANNKHGNIALLRMYIRWSLFANESVSRASSLSYGIERLFCSRDREDERTTRGRDLIWRNERTFTYLSSSELFVLLHDGWKRPPFCRDMKRNSFYRQIPLDAQTRRSRNAVFSQLSRDRAPIDRRERERAIVTTGEPKYRNT